MQLENLGSLVAKLSTLSLTAFTDYDCKDGARGPKTLIYSQNVGFGSNGHSTDRIKSIWLSRSLQDQEQLDLSHTGQGNGKTQRYACGEYVMTFRVGTEGGCQIIPSGLTADCIRLWHY